MIAIFNDNSILGLGNDLALATADAMAAINPEEDLDPQPIPGGSGLTSGETYWAVMTDRLAAEVKSYGGDIPFIVRDDGKVGLPEEMTSKEIWALYDEAQGSWSICDWAHHPVPASPDDEWALCDGGAPEHCRYCADVEVAAKEASRLAALAMEAMEQENLVSAAELAHRVFSLEIAFGDAPTWATWSRAVAEFCEVSS